MNQKMAVRAFTDEQCVQILRDYQSGMTWEAIGGKWHACGDTVKRAAQHGAETVGEELKPRSGRKLTDEQCAAIAVKKKELGLSNKALGEEYGVSDMCIRDALKRGQAVFEARNREAWDAYHADIEAEAEQKAASEDTAKQAAESLSGAPEDSDGKFDGETAKTHTALPESVWEAVCGRIYEARVKLTEAEEEAEHWRAVIAELGAWLEEQEAAP